MAETHGHCDPGFESVRELLKQRLERGSELGASLCVNIDGKNVLDIWGGHMDTAKTKPWEENTLGVVWSCSKVVTNLAAHILVDRGLLDVNEKVATYWPEFAANGKESIKVSHILSHTSGLSSWDAPMSTDDICNVKYATDKLAAQAPWWTPGEHSGYHLATQGHLVGELVRRISGKSLGQFITDEIAGPLGADFRLGVPEEDYSRTADIVPPEPISFEGLDPTSVAAKSLLGTPMSARLCMTPAFRNAELGASNGFSNARALAHIGSLVSLDGTVDGKKYLSDTAIDKILEEQIHGMDLVLFTESRFGLGVGLPTGPMSALFNGGDEGICFWGGWGGSILIMDRERRMTIGYVMNKMLGAGTVGNENTFAYVQEIYNLVNKLKSQSSL
ncbi:hypothetical protein N7495_002742 [Penicillium taxi]|uniref:uncharacterized protein n=1 Tax=Penicillium taxi TaxID=168475 RepID=UPI0025455F41|nr:uncharacterized protein N7495_002742 [Penicillium taxi]KAJ5902214.1 hypothetical protein N7495_002742 [Penicillium taxi]